MQNLIPNMKDVLEFTTLQDLLMNAQNAALYNELEPSVLTKEVEAKAYFIYTHYEFLANQLYELLKTKEGDINVQEKCEWLIAMYLNHLVTGELPTIQGKDEKIPALKDWQVWINFIDSLKELYEGIPRNYLQWVLTIHATYNELE